MITGVKTAPLCTEDLIDLFDNPDQIVDIDYKNSSLKDEGFFTFIGNAKVKCNLVNYQSMTFEEKENLLNHFLDWSITLEIDTLKKALISVLVDMDHPDLYSDFFTKEEIQEYRAKYPVETGSVQRFFYSMLVMIPSIATDFKTLILEPEIAEGRIESVKGLDQISPNVFNLTFYPKFLDLFLGLCDKDYQLAYYSDVLSTYRYQNMGFYELLIDEKYAPNLISVFNMFFTEQQPIEELIQEPA
jgi:hypothetical protein